MRLWGYASRQKMSRLGSTRVNTTKPAMPCDGIYIQSHHTGCVTPRSSMVNISYSASYHDQHVPSAGGIYPPVLPRGGWIFDPTASAGAGCLCYHSGSRARQGGDKTPEENGS